MTGEFPKHCNTSIQEGESGAWWASAWRPVFLRALPFSFCVLNDSKSGFSVAPDGSEMQVCEDALQAAGVIKDGFDAGGTIDITQSELIVPQSKPVRCRYQWQSLDGHALSEAGKQTLTDELGEWQEFVKKKYGAVLDARGRDSFHSTQGGFDSRIDNPVLAPCCQKRSQGYILTVSSRMQCD